MWLGGVSVFGSFAARYSSEAALCGNTRNICHKQTPLRYDWKTVESDVKHHSFIHSFILALQDGQPLLQDWHYVDLYLAVKILMSVLLQNMSIL